MWCKFETIWLKSIGYIYLTFVKKTTKRKNVGKLNKEMRKSHFWHLKKSRLFSISFMCTSGFFLNKKRKEKKEKKKKKGGGGRTLLLLLC